MGRPCAWCPRAPEARGSRTLRPTSHGICRPCLAAGLRSERSGYARSGLRFHVWDEDTRAGAEWAAELAAADVPRAHRAQHASD